MLESQKPILNYVDVNNDASYAFFKKIILDNMLYCFYEAEYYYRSHVIRTFEVPEDINFEELKWHLKSVGSFVKDENKVTLTIDIKKLKKRYYEEKELNERIDKYFEFINQLVPEVMLEEIEVPILKSDEGKSYVEIPFSNGCNLPLWEMERYFDIIPGFKYEKDEMQNILKLKVFDKELFASYYRENFRKLEEKRKKY